MLCERPIISHPCLAELVAGRCDGGFPIAADDQLARRFFRSSSIVSLSVLRSTVAICASYSAMTLAPVLRDRTASATTGWIFSQSLNCAVCRRSGPQDSMSHVRLRPAKSMDTWSSQRGHSNSGSVLMFGRPFRCNNFWPLKVA